MLIIRVDANLKIGAGHLIRMIALMQSASRFRCDTLFVGTIDSTFEKIVRYYKLNIKKKLLKSSPELKKATHVVFDGYHFSREEYGFFKEKTSAILYQLDDNFDLKYDLVDAIINPNFNSELKVGKYPERKFLFLGLEYMLIRDEFIVTANFPEKIENILITFGQGNSKLISKEIESVLLSLNKSLNKFNVKVLTNSKIDKNISKNFCIEKCKINIWEDIRWADVVISASGSTVWEILTMNKISIIKSIVCNQNFIYDQVTNAGLALKMEEDLLNQLNILSENITSLKELKEKITNFKNSEGKGYKKIFSNSLVEDL